MSAREPEANDRNGAPPAAGAAEQAPGHTEQPPSGRYGTFASMHYRDYRLLWLGQTSHALALWMEQIARPLLVLHITGNSAAQLGGVVATRMLPQLLFGVWAGVVSDWFDRKTILQTTKALVLILNIIFATALVTGNIELWHMYAFAFFRGTFMAFDQPARQSLVADIVPPHLVTNGVALLSSTQNIMRIFGASAGAVIAETLGLEAAFIAIAVIYSGSVVATQFLRVPRKTLPQTGGIRAMSRGLVEGANYVFGRPAIRSLLLLSLIYFVFGMSYMQVFAPLFAVNVLEVRGGLGLLLSVTGAGALVGALVIATRQPVRLGIVLPLVVTAFGALLIVFTLLSYLPRPYGVMLPIVTIAFVGAMQTVYMSLMNSMLLQSAPVELRGRVMSFVSLDRAMLTAGASAAGFLAAWQGVQVAQIVYGVICVAGGLTMLALAREFRAFSTLDAIAEHAQPSQPPLAAPQPAEARPADAQPAEAPSTASTRR